MIQIQTYDNVETTTDIAIAKSTLTKLNYHTML